MGRGGKSKKVRRASAGVKRQNQDQSLEWVINILKEGSDYDSGRSWTIYRVPRNMQIVYRNAFVPKIISIGPFHYRDHELQVMEEHKMRYLWRLLGRPRLQENGAEAEDDEVNIQVRKAPRLEDLARAMGVLEQKTRMRYSESFYVDSDEFVQMMVVDGCFVVELLRLYYKFDNEVSFLEFVRIYIILSRKLLRFGRFWKIWLLLEENKEAYFRLDIVIGCTMICESRIHIILHVVLFVRILPAPRDPAAASIRRVLCWLSMQISVSSLWCRLTIPIPKPECLENIKRSLISVVGRNHYGVFPLRDKSLNVREEHQADSRATP